MSNPVIKVKGLSKRYRIGLKEKQSETLIGQITQAIRSPWDNLKRLRELSRFGAEDNSVFWALKDINFEVKEGEVLGIIGKNGAGKSTLLKILSGITDPTEGKIEIRGRVASLLEVGTGFHPELSGRENIYMNGTILGMTRREIDSKLDEIIDFSGVEKFIDTPVKFYSSGMKVRLGFSVAAHLEPEILIIDEVLAVGDYEFQKKCLGKMENVAGQGRTVLFVSHNMEAVSNLCKKGVLLSSGEIINYGAVKSVLHSYLGLESNSGNLYLDPELKEMPYVRRIEVVCSDSEGHHNFGKPLKVDFEIFTTEFVPNATLSFQIFDEKNRAIIHCWIFQSDLKFCHKPGLFKVSCYIENPLLYMGRYSLTAHFGEGKGGRKYQTIEHACWLEINMHGIYRQFDWSPYSCTYLEKFEWNVEENI
ncbi:ABC transporter ATP-binding protein [Algoriphagus sp. PAP.12]|uniref:ABC transporter ATP-binding protein n=1 Tax=Algoriphagus sp. PAP.12 TaxID=2996678 RepID=UPI00227A062E|nr:polysaccharide ABC transporter ATP-binding protein [Algoriphagus sp. PAP.12]